MLYQALALQHGYKDDNKRIHQRHYAHAAPADDIVRIGGHIHQLIHRRQAIGGRQGNNHKEVGHLPDGHGFRAVADNAKDGEQAQGEPYAHLYIAHNVEQDEHGRRKHHEGEVVVPAFALLVIETVHQHPAYHQVQGKADAQFRHFLAHCHHGVGDGLYVHKEVVAGLKVPKAGQIVLDKTEKLVYNHIVTNLFPMVFSMRRTFPLKRPLRA